MMEIALRVTELSQAQAGLREMVGYYGQIAGYQKQISANASSRPHGGGGSDDGISVSGPMSRLARAQAALQQATTPASRFDAELAVHRAQRAVERGQKEMSGGPDFADKFITAIKSTRFGMDGGIQPLIGRTMDALNALPGPLGAAARGAAVLATAAVVAARHVSAIAEARAGGGSVGQIGMLSAMGIAHGQQAGIAGALRERIATDIYAQQAAMKLGIGAQVQRPFGETNETGILLNALGALRQITNQEERLRLARQLGIESMVHLANASDATWRTMREAGGTQQAIVSPKYMQDVASAQGQLGALGENFAALGMALGAPAIKLAVPALNALNYAVGGLARATDIALSPINYMIDAVVGAAEYLDQLFGGGNENQHMDANTRAVMENTQAIRTAGGPRASGAIPPALKGYMFEQAYAGGAIGMGAYSLNPGV